MNTEILSPAFIELVASSNTQDIHVGDLEYVLDNKMSERLQKYIRAILKETNERGANYLSTVELMFLRMYVDGMGYGVYLNNSIMTHL